MPISNVGHTYLQKALQITILPNAAHLNASTTIETRVHVHVCTGSQELVFAWMVCAVSDQKGLGSATLLSGFTPAFVT